MYPFFFTSSPHSFKIGSVGLLCEEVKQFPVLCDEQMKGYRQKYVVSNAWNAGTEDLEFIENGSSSLIIFHVVPG